jgi:hypothetical protein
MISRAMWHQLLILAGILASIAESFSSVSRPDLIRLRYQSRHFMINQETSSPRDNNKPESSDTTTQTTDDKDPPQKNPSLLRLAKLSLQDYKWRTSIFKETEADRLVEQSLARMMGDEPSYIRPMDAGDKKIGPLGLFEKSSVEWLRNVIEEEGRRAKKIVSLEGMLVRPKDSSTEDGELGPLGLLENQFVTFLDKIRLSEQERSRTKVLRPKDMEESMRGPLGEAELKAVTAIRQVLDSERLRMEQSKLRGGKVVRPIDVPGPIGEFEMQVLEVVKAEQQRKLDREKASAMLVRPKDSTYRGPLGELEAQAVEVVKKLTNEEKERLRNIQRTLEENRPMDQKEKTLLGVVETVVVGIVRAPILLFQIVLRVIELLGSENLDEDDANVLREQTETTKDLDKRKYKP